MRVATYLTSDSLTRQFIDIIKSRKADIHLCSVPSACASAVADLYVTSSSEFFTTYKYLDRAKCVFIGDSSKLSQQDKEIMARVEQIPQLTQDLIERMTAVEPDEFEDEVPLDEGFGFSITDDSSPFAEFTRKLQDSISATLSSEGMDEALPVWTGTPIEWSGSQDIIEIELVPNLADEFRELLEKEEEKEEIESEKMADELSDRLREQRDIAQKEHEEEVRKSSYLRETIPVEEDEDDFTGLTDGDSVGSGGVGRAAGSEGGSEGGMKSGRYQGSDSQLNADVIRAATAAVSAAIGNKEVTVSHKRDDVIHGAISSATDATESPVNISLNSNMIMDSEDLSEMITGISEVMQEDAKRAEQEWVSDEVEMGTAEIESAEKAESVEIESAEKADNTGDLGKNQVEVSQRDTSVETGLDTTYSEPELVAEVDIDLDISAITADIHAESEIVKVNQNEAKTDESLDLGDAPSEIEVSNLCNSIHDEYAEAREESPLESLELNRLFSELPVTERAPDEVETVLSSEDNRPIPVSEEEFSSAGQGLVRENKEDLIPVQDPIGLLSQIDNEDSVAEGLSTTGATATDAIELEEDEKPLEVQEGFEVEFSAVKLEVTEGKASSRQRRLPPPGAGNRGRDDGGGGNGNRRTDGNNEIMPLPSFVGNSNSQSKRYKERPLSVSRINIESAHNQPGLVQRQSTGSMLSPQPQQESIVDKLRARNRDDLSQSIASFRAVSATGRGKVPVRSTKTPKRKVGGARSKTGQVFLFGSTGRGAGATTIAYNFACHCSRLPHERVLLMDMDFISSELSRRVYTDLGFTFEDSCGIENVLHISADDYVSRLDIFTNVISNEYGDSLSFIRANPGYPFQIKDMIARVNFVPMIEVLKQMFDTIVIDIGSFDDRSRYKIDLQRAGYKVVAVFNCRNNRTIEDSIRVVNGIPSNCNVVLSNYRIAVNQFDVEKTIHRHILGMLDESKNLKLSKKIPLFAEVSTSKLVSDWELLFSEIRMI